MTDTHPSNAPETTPEENKLGALLFGWTSAAQTGVFLLIGLGLLSLILFGLGFMGAEGQTGNITQFFKFSGLISLAIMSIVILAAWPLRHFLERPEGFYEPEQSDND